MIRKVKKVFAGFFILLFILVLSNVNVQQQENLSQDLINIFEASDTQTIQEAQIVRVVDGDTLVVMLDDKEQKVRLIGVDTPESVHPDKSKNTVAGIRASDYTKALLPPGTLVWLEKDVSDVDRYGRLLRYVWLEEPQDPNDIEEVKSKMLNARLLVDELAVAKEYAPDTKWSALFDMFEQEVCQNEEQS